MTLSLLVSLMVFHIKKKILEGLRVNLVVWYVFNIHEALGSMSSTSQKMKPSVGLKYLFICFVDTEQVI